MSITFKNPLGQALGVAIRKERERLGLQSSEVAHAIGVKPSFYSLIENGSNYLHVNKSVMVVEAFECEFDLDAVTKVLMAISMMEAAAREMQVDHQEKDLNYKQLYFDGLSAAIDKLSVHDEKKLGRLLSCFDINKFSNLTPKESAKFIEKNSLDNEVLEYLSEYESYGFIPTIRMKNYISDRINTTVPTIYFDFITGFLNGLEALPIQTNLADMWKWENSNKDSFKELIGYIANKEFVISESNLNRYHWNYLWENSFTQARFLVDSDEDSTKLKNEFKDVFKKRLQDSITGNCKEEHVIEDASNKMELLSWAMEKIEFRSIRLQDKDKGITTYQINQEKERSIGTWIFVFNDPKNSVGFMAKSIIDKTTFKEGISLSLYATEEKYQKLIELWNSSKNG